MRLDKMLSECGLLSRKETARAVRAGRITVGKMPAKRADQQVDPNVDEVMLDGAPVRYRRYAYVMLNKPDGYISATEDGRDPVVTSLLPETYQKMELFPAGRLDKHTLGLMLLTNDGQLAHRLLSPKSHVEKSYAFRVKFPISSGATVRVRVITRSSSSAVTLTSSGESTIALAMSSKVSCKLTILYLLIGKISQQCRSSSRGT